MNNRKAASYFEKAAIFTLAQECDATKDKRLFPMLAPKKKKK